MGNNLFEGNAPFQEVGNLSQLIVMQFVIKHRIQMNILCYSVCRQNSIVTHAVKEKDADMYHA